MTPTNQLVFCALLTLIYSGAAAAQNGASLDSSKALIVHPLEMTVKASPTLPEAMQTALVSYLKAESVFANVVSLAESKDKNIPGELELTAKLVQFKGGSMATRMMVGLGSGRASATVDFAIRDTQSKSVLWQKTVKEKASFWSNSASSAAQRAELPEKIAQTLVKELKKGRR